MPRSNLPGMPRILTPALATVAVFLALTACAPPVATEPTVDPTVEISAEPTAPTEPDPASSNSLCELLTLDEAGVVLAAPATISTSTSYGDLASDFGGQCVWSSDPSGDIYTDDARVLELIAYVPDSMNPAPDGAPEVGSSAIVETESGVLFAGAERIFMLRLSGAASYDASALAAARDLVPSILGRL